MGSSAVISQSGPSGSLCQLPQPEYSVSSIEIEILRILGSRFHFSLSCAYLPTYLPTRSVSSNASTMDTLTSLMYSLLSWRGALIAFLGMNIKSLPLFWHLKLFYLIFRNYSPHSRTVTGVTDDSVPVLFAPVSVFTRAPLLEIDWSA